ncbi:MAG: Mrp/NBP35 family ATP-binding protein [Candidatus Delongbacteria bacterium]|jgi:ATP-binding protein involved in chromosome partitioning|nr:Mrp/NBP35 family ATP-binding protein [Candidatus Delongbacteria bacterium]
MELNKDNVLKTLQEVLYPGNGKNIVELNMVDNLSVDGNAVKFDLIFEKDNDPFITSVKQAAVKILEGAFGKDTIKIRGSITTKAKQLTKEAKVNTDVGKHGLGKVKNIVAVASGKGGVGKSTVAVNLAVAMAMHGYKVGLIDADIFGPSIPKMFGLEGEKPQGKKEDGKEWILPFEKFGVKMLSVGFFVDKDAALVWRGPMASNALKQLMNDADWGELDYLICDLPPGTSDIHLTLVQTVAVTGAVIVSTPQEVALADARKGIGMFSTKGIEVPVLGLIENMAWFTPEELPDNKYYIFGKEGCKKLARVSGVPLLGQIPLVQSIREGGDEGKPASTNLNSITGKAFEKAAVEMMKQVDIRKKEKPATKRVEIKNK